MVFVLSILSIKAAKSNRTVGLMVQLLGVIPKNSRMNIFMVATVLYDDCWTCLGTTLKFLFKIVDKSENCWMHSTSWPTTKQ